MARVRLPLYLGETLQKLGPGKVRLLEAVREHGSISGAARRDRDGVPPRVDSERKRVRRSSLGARMRSSQPSA